MLYYHVSTSNYIFILNFKCTFYIYLNIFVEALTRTFNRLRTSINL